MKAEDKILAEKYVNDMLSEEEKRTFQQTLHQDKEVIEYINLLKILRKGVERYAENRETNALIGGLIEQHRKERNHHRILRRYFLISILSLGICLGAYIMYQNLNKNEQRDISPSPVETIEKGQMNQSPTETHPKIEDVFVKNEEDKNDNPKKITGKRKKNKLFQNNNKYDNYDKPIKRILASSEVMSPKDFNPTPNLEPKTKVKGVNTLAKNSDYQDSIDIMKVQLYEENYKEARAILPSSIKSEDVDIALITSFYAEDKKLFYALSKSIKEDKATSTDIKLIDAMYSLINNPSELQKILSAANAVE